MLDKVDGASEKSRPAASSSASTGKIARWRHGDWMAGSAGVMLAVLMAGCETRESVDQELYIAELEAQVTQLETDLNAAYQEVSRLSGTLSTQVVALEASMNDLNLRVMDVPNASDVPAAIREMEAGMAVALQRVRDVRGTSDTLAEYLQ